MDEKELRKFNYEFIKENNPDKNFVLCTETLMKWVSSIPKKNQDLARLYLTKLTDRMEINYLNSTLETTYSIIPQNKRDLLEGDETDQVEQETIPQRYFAKSTQFTGLYPIEPVSKPSSSSTIDIPLKRESKRVRIEGGLFKNQRPTAIEPTVNYFCTSWSEKAKGKTVNILLQDLTSDPDGWKMKMNDIYELVFQAGILEDYFKKNTTLDKLCNIYKELEPSNFLAEQDEKSKLIAKMKQSLVALILYLRVKGEYRDDEHLVYGHLRRLLSNPTTSSPLWRHCKHVYIFYQQLGDMVILLPQIFDKIFFLQYPTSEMQPFIDLVKNNLPTHLTYTKRFSTILNENLEK
ncbi:hypothetical protein BDF21DRAFT_465559 [Thamnidium elegans]|uniref:Uncharacterized protein n=1 Tax=Thamnidium elegans TaxID=101142 RepID=A0A8H7VVL3_9FUNG|nr:hypothetical protein INT48_008420 [Thamnidium elegans]KAI8070139.1 hypothetical protein BDF21DRAFT_465559 [Thamnidium elegans]